MASFLSVTASYTSGVIFLSGDHWTWNFGSLDCIGFDMAVGTFVSSRLGVFLSPAGGCRGCQVGHMTISIGSTVPTKNTWATTTITKETRLTVAYFMAINNCLPTESKLLVVGDHYNRSYYPSTPDSPFHSPLNVTLTESSFCSALERPWPKVVIDICYPSRSDSK